MAVEKHAEGIHAKAPGPSQQLMAAQQEAHALELASLEQERVSLVDAHHVPLASAEARIREQAYSLPEIHLVIDRLRNEASATTERVLVNSCAAGAREAELCRQL